MTDQPTDQIKPPLDGPHQAPPAPSSPLPRRVRKARVQIEESVLSKTLRRYADAKTDAERAEALRTDLQVELIGLYRAEEVKSYWYEDGDERVTGTLVEQTRSKLDADRLKKALGARVWEKVTKRVVDDDKLEAAIRLGEVDPNIVATCSQESTSAHIRLTRRKKRR